MDHFFFFFGGGAWKIFEKKFGQPKLLKKKFGQPNFLKKNLAWLMCRKKKFGNRVELIFFLIFMFNF